ncbi:LacI family transcriptional regulator [Paenibacillus mesophilus]|uniref:LacI family DNA-binding transcriptional regulator n=1 Tax=Paenibacillus mesophilus TaxID=2582849 RepID=UPI00110DAD62|nr:LacI family DNA-binding transcriptional regulator [Paenibacillus mesophilus]TMV47583.1 LacI family transcriptional regulator [Paenibacillus mesophilus]
MASIKEIAALAKVSQGTASLVLNGKGDQFRISAPTQERIFAAARELDYRPNISAKRLRSSGETVAPIIALFWTMDPRSQLIGRYLNGIQKAIHRLDREYEILIQPYVGSQLQAEKSLVTGTRFNGAIIALPTEEDERYLEQADIKVPLVLYQRSSDKYCSVNVDNYLSGQKVANLFAKRGHRKVGLLVPDISSTAIRLRMSGFVDTCRERGLLLKEEYIQYGSFSELGGYQTASAIFSRADRPSALFCISDQMAVGALYALHEMNLSVPEQVEVVGHDDDAVSEFSIPPLSTVHLPVEEMAHACVNMVVDLMSHKIAAPVSRLFESTLITRKSCEGE